MAAFLRKAWLVLIALGPLAGAGPTTDWGDFSINNQGIDTDVRLFGQSASPNPTPFPPPSAIQQANTYPAAGAGTVTVQQMQDFLSGRGYPNNQFGLNVEVQPGRQTDLASMVWSIGGSPVASATGSFVVKEGTHSIFAEMDLKNHDPSDPIAVSYDTFTGSDNIKKIDLAATPEPASALLMGTGFLGLLIAKILRRTRRATA